jgi:hypothetical protein
MADADGPRAYIEVEVVHAYDAQGRAIVRPLAPGWRGEPVPVPAGGVVKIAIEPIILAVLAPP